ncbi:MAG: hypothetical protein CL610_07060 [Anaerolineaceae bacterium]|nr:hypothetical protein [Anaerolineaceae bacterium]
MTSFRKRFLGIKHLSACDQSESNVEWLNHQLEPYLEWRILALEQNAVLLCEPFTTDTWQPENMIILEGNLMEAWFALREARQ